MSIIRQGKTEYMRALRNILNSGINSTTRLLPYNAQRFDAVQFTSKVDAKFSKYHSFSAYDVNNYDDVQTIFAKLTDIVQVNMAILCFLEGKEGGRAFVVHKSADNQLRVRYDEHSGSQNVSDYLGRRFAHQLPNVDTLYILSYNPNKHSGPRKTYIGKFSADASALGKRPRITSPRHATRQSSRID